MLKDFLSFVEGSVAKGASYQFLKASFDAVQGLSTLCLGHTYKGFVNLNHQMRLKGSDKVYLLLLKAYEGIVRRP